jgi:cardiolipin hydrolase
MDAEALAALLRKTADDDRLSASERSALRDRIREASLDERVRAVLRHRAFELAREHAFSGPPGAALDWLEDVLKLLLPEHVDVPLAEVHFSPGELCARRIVAQFNVARRAVDVCVFTITDDRLSDAIHAAHQRGVKVRIVTDNDKAFDEGSDVRRLAAAGVPVRVDDSPFHMHHKFAIFDGKALLTGSYNWTRGAAMNNQENMMAIDDPRLVAAFQGEFDRLWEKFAGTPL